MALATATITYDLANLVGLPHYKGTSVTATTNIPGDTVVDTDGNKIRLGSGRGTIDANGKGSVVVWVPGTGSNPASWQTYLHVRYRDPRAHGGATERTFGPFTITANADLADLVAEQEVPPNYAEGLVAEMTALRDETALISGLTGEDAAIAALVNSSSSDTKAALSATIAAQVPGEVATSLAADDTPALAAAAAVDDALDTSPRIPKVVTDESGHAVVWRTETGRRFLGAITQDGFLAPAGGIELGTSAVVASSDPAYVAASTAPVAGLAHDRMAEDALSADGTVPAWVLARWAARMPGVNNPKARGIICRGDSLTAGAYGAGTSYPQHLSILCPGVPVAKRGAPGERSKEISMRQGSTALTTTSVVTIPASGGVTVPMNTTLMFTNPDATNGVPDGTALVGSLNGIQGKLTITGGVFTFTRTTAGAAFDVPTGTPWLDDWESTHRDWNQLIWVGRNNVTATPADAATYAATIAAYRTSGDYVVISVTNATSEPAGSANYNTIIGMNNSLAAAHGARYFDLRAWLISSGLAAVGLTATAADTTAISEDRIPPSLLAADGLHFNADGYKDAAIGIRAHINGRGWL